EASATRQLARTRGPPYTRPFGSARLVGRPMAADQIILTAETGRPTGSRSSRRLRAEGKIPAVVYGLDTEPKPIAVEWSALRAALVTDAGMNALIDLDVDGEKKLTMVYDMQRHPVRRDVTHV